MDDYEGKILIINSIRNCMRFNFASVKNIDSLEEAISRLSSFIKVIMLDYNELRRLKKSRTQEIKNTKLILIKVTQRVSEAIMKLLISFNEVDLLTELLPKLTVDPKELENIQLTKLLEKAKEVHQISLKYSSTLYFHGIGKSTIPFFESSIKEFCDAINYEEDNDFKIQVLDQRIRTNIDQAINFIMSDLNVIADYFKDDYPNCFFQLKLSIMMIKLKTVDNMNRDLLFYPSLN